VCGVCIFYKNGPKFVISYDNLAKKISTPKFKVPFHPPNLFLGFIIFLKFSRRESLAANSFLIIFSNQSIIFFDDTNQYFFDFEK